MPLNIRFQGFRMPRLVKTRKGVTRHSMPKMSETSSSSSAPSNGPIQNQGVQEITVAESEAAADCLALAFADDEVAMYFVKTDDTGDWSKEEKWKMHVRIMHSIVEAHCLKGLALTIGPNYDCVALW